MIFSFQFLSTPLVCVKGASISLFFWRITLKKNLGKSAPELQTHWLRRIRATRPQTELPLAERLVNMDDAFEISLEVQNHQILLLDDVMTTGSTLNAAARCLKEAGASSVGALVLGRKMWDSFEDGFTDA